MRFEPPFTLSRLRAASHQVLHYTVKLQTVRGLGADEGWGEGREVRKITMGFRSWWAKQRQRY